MAITSRIERLAERMGGGSGSRKIGRTTLTRLSLYYAISFLIVAGLIILTDNMKGAWLTGEKAGAGSDAGSLVNNANPSSWSALTGFADPLFRSLPPLATGAAAVIGSFLLALPVAFTYVRTRSRLKYDQALVQTVIMLPVVVSAILIVVQNSVALAFSLAGIVAAVRFRNNLKDSRDAVYIFAVVGIGFASGVGMLAVAAFLSIFFCVLELLLWKLDLTADHERTFGLLCMPATPAGPANSPPLVAATGEASAASPSADTGLLAIGGGNPEPGNGAAKKPMERLLVYVTDPEKARGIAEAVLEELTKAYKLKKTRNGAKDQFVLEYRVRFRKKSPSGAVIDRLHAAGPYVIAAEVVAADAPEKG